MVHGLSGEYEDGLVAIGLYALLNRLTASATTPRVPLPAARKHRVRYCDLAGGLQDVLRNLNRNWSSMYTPQLSEFFPTTPGNSS